MLAQGATQILDVSEAAKWVQARRSRLIYLGKNVSRLGISAGQPVIHQDPGQLLLVCNPNQAVQAKCLT